MQDLRRDRRFRYILVFKNHGAAAGASLDHSCTQLIALPIVPREVRDEVDGAKAHFEAKERCVFCDILRQETKDGHRLIAENADIVAVAPYAPRFPFETWMLPRRHEAHFDNAPRHEYASLARLLGEILRRMNKALDFPPYNLLIHTAPIAEPAEDYYHWHVEIMPKLAHQGRGLSRTGRPGSTAIPRRRRKPRASCAPWRYDRVASRGERVFWRAVARCFQRRESERRVARCFQRRERSRA